MSDTAVRALVVGVVIALALLIAWVASRLARPHHPPVDVGDLASRPGVVVFTSTDCSSCKEALAVARSQSLPVREVTNELESARLEAAGVLAVPLTVVVDGTGSQVASFAGVPRRRALRRAVRRATD